MLSNIIFSDINNLSISNGFFSEVLSYPSLRTMILVSIFGYILLIFTKSVAAE
jgi:hypothetical protein